jgi:hypothetical protein
MPESRSVPASWSELITKITASRDRRFQVLAENAAELQSASDSMLAVDFGAAADLVAGLSVVLGPAACRHTFTLFDSGLQAILGLLAGRSFEHGLVGGLSVLRYIHSARCSGARLPAPAVKAEVEWLPAFVPHRGRVAEKYSDAMAFAALALGRFDLVPTFLGGGPLPASIEPGQTFQFNVQKFVRYMATAAVGGAKAEEVLPAFREFVLVFPFKLGAESLDWGELLYAARAYYVYFEHRSVETVSQTLHEFVTGIAAGA